MTVYRYRKGDIELRLGDYRDVLADVEPDAVITDPPYGARTHRGNERMGRFERSDLSYAAWTAGDIALLVERYAAVDGWLFCMTSDDLTGVYRDVYSEAGRYDFAPVPILQHRPRLQGDGPGSCAVYGMPARPRARAFMSWGSLPGWYLAGTDRDGHIGGKPLSLMRRIVRDYSRPGDIVCDPCSGGATTLIAAAMEGRRAIGAELDPATFELACKRIERTPITPPLFIDDAPKAVQGDLL